MKKEVLQLGEISITELNNYHSDNPERRLVSMMGVVFDVTDAVDKYGPDGGYKEFAGHDITINMACSKMDEKWLDMMIRLEPQYLESAREWLEFYRNKYPECGILSEWRDDPALMPEPSDQVKADLKAKNDCCIQ
jgi:hypothetical protein